MIIISWTTVVMSVAVGDELQVPEPPRFAADSLQTPLDRQPQPIDTRTQAATEPGQGHVPSDGELVSILKRNMTMSNETLEMKDAPEWFQNMMQRIVRENVPAKYVQENDWGKTDKRWDGLHVRRKGALRLTTKRRWKEVNHGTWKRYEITLLNPNEHLRMRIENVHDAGKGKVGFEVGLGSKLHVHGRQAQWAKGVQIYSMSADADADVQMRMSCEVGLKLDAGKFPPDVVLVLNVRKANLSVTDFQMKSISKLDGPLVKQLSNNIHEVLLDKIAEKRHQLPEKINREIAKNEDKMRWSLSAFAASKWNALTGHESDPGELPPNHSQLSNGPALAAAARTSLSKFPTRSVSIEESDAALIDLIGPEPADSEIQSVGPILMRPDGER